MCPGAFFKLVLMAALTAPTLAAAQSSAPPTRIRGAIERFDDHTLMVKSGDGKSATVVLAPDFTVRAVVAETLADIKPGEKVGITSIKGPEGVRQAIEIHIFPAQMSSVRMGEFPSDRGAASLMTNAPVAQVSSAPQGRSIKVALNGKEQEITVPPDTPIVTYATGDASLLKPGAAVFIIARKEPDGRLTATGVTAEKNGIKPPM
jgi:hypothetical protein